MNPSRRSPKCDSRSIKSTSTPNHSRREVYTEGKRPSFHATKSPLFTSKLGKDEEFKIVQNENEELRAELSYIKSIYKQLIEESPKEKFDERRINLLKSQVIQLERQVSLQSWALNARTDILTEIEGQLLNVIDHLRTVQTASDVTSSSKISDILSIVDGIRHYLFKTIEMTNPELLTLPSLYIGKFLKSKRNSQKQPEVTLLDTCSGKLEHVNLKQVAKLESKLSKLYKHLILLEQTLHQSNETNATSSPGLVRTSKHIGQPISSHFHSSLESTTQILHDCCQDLLSLSVLLPSAPWPPLSKPINKSLTLEDVMAHMPPGLSKKKEEEIHSVVDSLMKAINYNQHMCSIENKILKEELSYHQKVYQLQLDYTTSLISSVSDAYSEFEKSTIEMLCDPLDTILDKYEALKASASEEDLRQFLTSFKDNADKISDAVECLQTHRNNAGHSALSEYGQQFVNSLNTLTKECGSKRDELMKSILDLKQSESTTEEKDK